jgi:hypothetical protein
MVICSRARRLACLMPRRKCALRDGAPDSEPTLSRRGRENLVGSNTENVGEHARRVIAQVQPERLKVTNSNYSYGFPEKNSSYTRLFLGPCFGLQKTRRRALFSGAQR